MRLIPARYRRSGPSLDNGCRCQGASSVGAGDRPTLPVVAGRAERPGSTTSTASASLSRRTDSWLKLLCPICHSSQTHCRCGAAPELRPGKRQARSSDGDRSCALGRTYWGRPQPARRLPAPPCPGQPLQALRQEAHGGFQTEIAQTRHPCHSRVGHRGSLRDFAVTHRKQTIAFLANRSYSTL